MKRSRARAGALEELEKTYPSKDIKINNILWDIAAGDKSLQKAASDLINSRLSKDDTLFLVDTLRLGLISEEDFIFAINSGLELSSCADRALILATATKAISEAPLKACLQRDILIRNDAELLFICIAFEKISSEAGLLYIEKAAFTEEQKDILRRAARECIKKQYGLL